MSMSDTRKKKSSQRDSTFQIKRTIYYQVQEAPMNPASMGDQKRKLTNPKVYTQCE
jgi:hypothetical protein